MTERLAIHMTVNGQAVASQVEPRTLLAYYLRDDLGLTGTHVGCDTSQCGACTVLMDGSPVKSCTVLAVQADQHHITTVEGLALGGGASDRVQRAFQEAHGLQCGFCTPGVLMLSKWMVEQQPSASETEIRDLLDGILCRCTGYENIVKAVQMAMEIAEEDATQTVSGREVSS